ncbi:MAG: hypothetical protein KF901_13925 [Myxococcales bacterium]|nr:hypothetical protein [Myxococcales bacterium]
MRTPPRQRTGHDLSWELTALVGGTRTLVAGALDMGILDVTHPEAAIPHPRSAHRLR